MKKHFLFLLLMVLSLFIKAQRDSVKNIRLSAIQVESGFATSGKREILQIENIQRSAANDPLVNADLNTYNKNPQEFNRHDFGKTFAFIGFKLYATLKDSKKRIGKEVFIGLRYALPIKSESDFSKNTSDTIGVYAGTGGGKNIRDRKCNEYL